MIEYENASPAEGPEPEESSERDGTEWGGFRMPAGFSRSLLPNVDDYLANVIAPLKERKCSLMPDYSAILRDAFAPVNERLQEQMASIVASVPTVSMPPLDLPALHAPVINPATQEILERISEQQATAVEACGSRSSRFRPGGSPRPQPSAGTAQLQGLRRRDPCQPGPRVRRAGGHPALPSAAGQDDCAFHIGSHAKARLDGLVAI